MSPMNQKSFIQRRRLPRQEEAVEGRWWEHTHEGRHSLSAPKWEYAGFSDKCPGYHAFKCVAPADPPVINVELCSFERGQFKTRSKAGKGGCSTYLCPGEAVLMAIKFPRAYCDKCGVKANPAPEEPCTSVNISPCYKSSATRTCSLCEKYHAD